MAGLVSTGRAAAITCAAVTLTLASAGSPGISRASPPALLPAAGRASVVVGRSQAARAFQSRVGLFKASGFPSAAVAASDRGVGSWTTARSEAAHVHHGSVHRGAQHNRQLPGQLRTGRHPDQQGRSACAKRNDRRGPQEYSGRGVWRITQIAAPTLCEPLAPYAQPVPDGAIVHVFYHALDSAACANDPIVDGSVTSGIQEVTNVDAASAALVSHATIAPIHGVGDVFDARCGAQVIQTAPGLAGRQASGACATLGLDGVLVTYVHCDLA